MVALGRLAELDDTSRVRAAGAVLFLVASPAAIFLAVGYTESLFLAFALCSWLAARNRHWTLAVLLAGGASVIRVEGLFLCAALVIGSSAGPTAGASRALAMFVPALLPLAGYELYLRLVTGDWLAWLHAEAAGWDRHLTNPVDTFRTAWTAGFSHEFAAPVNFVFQLEILAVAVGVITTVALLASRRWPEAVYVGLTVGSLATSVWYESVPRALLLLWPLWCGLAAFAARRPWIGQLYLAVSVPISVSSGCSSLPATGPGAAGTGLTSRDFAWDVTRNIGAIRKVEYIRLKSNRCIPAGPGVENRFPRGFRKSVRLASRYRRRSCTASRLPKHLKVHPHVLPLAKFAGSRSG